MGIEAATGWAMLALIVIMFAAALVRLVSVIMAAKALVRRVSALPGRLPFDPLALEAPVTRLEITAGEAAPLQARTDAAIRRIRAAVAVWRRIGAQAAYTANAAAAVARELR